jgi:UPF0755 protein
MTLDEDTVQNKWSRGKWAAALIGAAFLLLLGLVLGAAAYAADGLKPTTAGEPVTITIPSGTGSARIAELLEENGLIRDSFIFKLYLRYKGEGQRFQAGVYQLAPGTALDEIIGKLNRGDIVKVETIRFTIPEGYTVVQMADKLAEAGVANREAFLAVARNQGEVEPPEAWAFPNIEDIKEPLEGYLYPETYEMKKDSTEREIIQRMLEETKRKLSTLPSDWPEKLKESGLTMHELLTVASLIEREVIVDEERPLVAGVIYHRLRIDMPLQIDATVQYALEKPKERLLYVDLELESPYNTYLHRGLPPGPIASPGLASIRAALYPQDTSYLFYVTKKDGTNTHLFAETFEEHQRNIQQSNKNAKR